MLQTNLGLLRGSAVESLKIFRGIRYAQAPVGDKRFAPPVAVPAWQYYVFVDAFDAFTIPHSNRTVICDRPAKTFGGR